MRGPDSGCVFNNWSNHHLITVFFDINRKRRKLFTWLALLEIHCICSFQDNLRSIVTPRYLVCGTLWYDFLEDRITITRAVEGEFSAHNQYPHLLTPQQSTEVFSIWKNFAGLSNTHIQGLFVGWVLYHVIKSPIFSLMARPSTTLIIICYAEMFY